MKKKVLFALIALLSFVSAWADGETIVNTNGTAGFVVLPAGGVAAEALAVKIGTETLPGTAIYASDGVTAVNGNITEVGNYFLKVENSESLYPFQAAKKFTSFEIIDNEDKYESSSADGVLSLYYPWADAGTPYKEDLLYKGTGETDEPRAANCGDWTVSCDAENSVKGPDGQPVYQNCVRNWQGALANPVEGNTYKSGWPWVGVDFRNFDFDGNSYKVVLRYEDQETTPYEIIDKPLKKPNGQDVIFGEGTDQKIWAVEKLAQTFEKPEWSIGLGGFVYSEVNHGTDLEPDWVMEWVYQNNDDRASYEQSFVADNLSVLLFPAEEPNANLLRDYAWTMTPTTVGYNAQAQAPTITVTAKDLSGETVTVPQFNETDNSINWIPRYFTTGENPEEVDEMINKGVYDVFVYLPDADELIGEAKQFEITAFQLTLGASTTYKQLGDPDPAPEYGYLYDNAPEAVKAEAANLIIDGLYLHRIPEYNDPENDYAGREIKFFMEMNNAAVKNADGTTNTNYMISISSTEAWLIITKKLIRDGEFRAVVNDDIFTYDGRAKEPTDITLEQDMNFDKRGEADYEADWKLVSGLGSVLGSVNANFDITYANNIAADAYGQPRLQGEEPDVEEVYDWMANVSEANRATVILTPKADGNFASQIPLGNDQYLEGADNVTGQFKIKQRNINTATIAEIDEVIFKNADFMPEPAVTYDNGTEAGLTLVKNEDFTYAYKDNKYVGTATVTVEAANVVTVGSDVTIKTYTGNWWNKQDATFEINEYKFTLKPVDIEKTVGDTDPDPLTTLEPIPSANMVDGDGNALTFPVQDVTTLLKEGWTLSRAKGEFVAVYDINVNNAELKASDPADVSDPAHNYIMTVETGVLEIVEPHAFYISSVGVEREFRSGDQTVPFDGFYLYHRTNTGEYIEVTEGDVYDELTEKITANEWYGVGSTGPNAGTYNNRIRPVIPTNLGIDVARMAVADYQHVDIEGVEVNEGSFIITPRKVTIVAEDKTSVFGEDYQALTYKVYDGHVEENFLGLEESEVQLNQGTAYAANTIAYFGGLRTEIATAVAAAEKPLTANVTDPIVIVDHYLNDTQTTVERNPNYDIKFINGTYTVTPSLNKLFIDLVVTKNYGSAEEVSKVLTVKFGASKDAAEDYEENEFDEDDYNYVFINGELIVPEPTNAGEYGKADGFTVVGVENNTELPEVIDGYPVVYDGKLIINKGGEVIIAVKTLGAEYPVPPTLSFDNKRVTVTGATFAEIAAEGDFVLTYTKPDYGFIKNGAPVQVEFNGKPYGTAAGQAVSADDWAWVANYESVTVKSGSVKVTAPDEITLDILAFNRASYEAANESADELIRDYDGTTVKKVYLVCSGQSYTLNGDQWYSMVLPFDTYPRYISQVLGGYAVVDILDTEKGKATKGEDIRFTTHTGELAANTPFIFKTDWDFTVDQAVTAESKAFEGDIEISYPVLGRVIGVDEDENDIEFAWPADQNGNQFIGTYTAAFGKNVDAENAFLNDEKNLIINLSGNVSPASNTAYLRPLGAYIQMANGYHAANARIFIEEADGTTTIINAVDADADAAEFAEGWYTVTGVKLTAEPTVSGTYIYNGKKVFFQAK